MQNNTKPMEPSFNNRCFEKNLSKRRLVFRSTPKTIVSSQLKNEIKGGTTTPAKITAEKFEL